MGSRKCREDAESEGDRRRGGEKAKRNCGGSLQRYRVFRRKECVAEQDGSKTSSSLQRHKENRGKECVAEREGWDSDGRRGERRGKSFKKTQNFSKKEKCDERDENLSYSERDCMEILLYCGDCIGEDHKYFCGA